MGTIVKVNNILCANIAKIDNVLKASAYKLDDNTFCPVSPTPTPTPSPAVNCVDGETTNGGFYSFYDCCGVYFEGSGELPFVACYDANKPNTGISFGDPCGYSCVTPTPTITPTMTPTPTVTSTPRVTPTFTPTPSVTPQECNKDCCFVELCYSSTNCRDACLCNELVNVYLTICTGDPCELSVAFGIFDNDSCTTPAKGGYYSDGTNCYLWQGGVLSFNSAC